MEYRGMWAAYAPYALFAVLAAVPAILNNWQPWEIIALVAVLAAAGAVAAWAWAWYAARVRASELAALSSDEQAARLLGEALGQCGLLLPGEYSKEIWDVFATVPSESKRAMALAAGGLIANMDAYDVSGAVSRIHGMACGFRGPAAPAPAITTEEQAARALGEAVGRCANILDDKMTRELWDVFTSLPGDAKREFASALAGFVATVNLNLEPGEKMLALAHSFRAVSELSPALTP